MPKLIDTHCHVNFNAYKDDADEVIKRTLKEDTWIINVGSQSSTSERSVKISEKYKKGVFAAVALHPLHLWESHVDETEISFKTRPEKFDRNFYKSLAKNPKVVAIGETGLDYFHLPKDLKEQKKIIIKQKEVFREHLDLARELDLPVIIHCRDAHQDILDILKDEKGVRGVVHCYTDGWDTAKRYLDLGFYISFTGLITFNVKSKQKEIQDKILEVVKKAPIEKIMIETDAPYLTPVPHRGKRNEPLFVQHVAEKIAEIRGVSFEEVAKQTTTNAIEFFGLK
ncbi:MAG: TatD family hydrolase [Parcubacteria group bacterium]|nr:TatD family hydrolase [Parcubacteria group bacterium]